MRVRIVLVALAFAALASASPALAQAQPGTGAIAGVVLDASDAAVPAARVTVTNIGTGLSRTVETSKTGQFSAPVLPPGAYQRTTTGRSPTARMRAGSRWRFASNSESVEVEGRHAVLGMSACISAVAALTFPQPDGAGDHPAARERAVSPRVRKVPYFTVFNP